MLSKVLQSYAIQQIPLGLVWVFSLNLLDWYIKDEGTFALGLYRKLFCYF